MAPAVRRKLVSAKVNDAEKRRYPSKHYVYIIQVTWDDSSNTVIFRRYSKFFDFQISLLESFPHEGGIKDPSERIIPFLPGKILFGRSHIRDVAMKRLKPIDEYCNALIQLPPNISQSGQVLDFFESKQEDLHPPKEEFSKKRRKDDQGFDRRRKPTRSVSFNGVTDIGEISGPILLEQYKAVADYTRTQPKELSVAAGQPLDVIEKHENGWWFVSDEEGERGWVPGVYLEKPDGTSENLITKESQPGEGEKYITTSKFTGSSDEISFGAGVLVEVLQKNLEGWWFISYQGNQGWAPASYLEKPAAAVLRQTNQVEVIPSIRNLRGHRRSLPADTVNAIVPSPITTPPVSTSASPKPRRHLDLTKTNSNPAAARRTIIASISRPQPSAVKPPPKKSSIKRGSFAQKPQMPPPLPPSPTLQSEPLYEYFTTSAFSADIPHGISFREDKKVKVLEKSPGDWWYISMDGDEGWAPASHIKKEFTNNKPHAPPSRPKPPKMAEKVPQTDNVVTNAASKKWTKPVENDYTNSQQDVVKPSFPPKSSPAQRPLPCVPAPRSHSADKDDKQATPASNSSVKKVIERPRPPSITNKNVNRPAANSNADAAANNFKSALKSAVANKQKAPIERAASPVIRPPIKPAAISTKPKSNIGNSVKPGIGSAAKQPTKPPPPALGVKKPSVPNKGGVKLPKAADSKEPGQIDFRSVLKPAANKPVPAGAPTNKTGNVAKKPSLPGKPSLPSKVTSNVQKDLSAGPPQVKASARFPVRGKVATEKERKPPALVPSIKSKPSRPDSKPVLRRFQADALRNMNGNNSNSVNPPCKPDVFVVNRVETEQIIPSVPLPFMLRGSPDGQVDDPCLEDDSNKGGKPAVYKTTVQVGEKSDRDKKFTAVADFQPEDTKEMGFRKGDEAVLLKKSKNDWWYMQMGDECGWVPCAFFKPKQETEEAENIHVSTSESDVIQPNICQEDVKISCNEPELDPIYSEIDELPPPAHESPDSAVLYKAGSGFGATDSTMVTITYGDVIEVLEKTETGWWFVKVVSSTVNVIGQEGWVPSDYLDKL